jgi:hypothetical protein
MAWLTLLVGLLIAGGVLVGSSVWLAIQSDLKAGEYKLQKKWMSVPRGSEMQRIHYFQREWVGEFHTTNATLFCSIAGFLLIGTIELWKYISNNKYSPELKQQMAESNDIQSIKTLMAENLSVPEVQLEGSVIADTLTICNASFSL